MSQQWRRGVKKQEKDLLSCCERKRGDYERTGSVESTVGVHNGKCVSAFVV